MEKAWKKCPIMFFKQKSWVWPAIHQERSLVRNFLSCLSRTLADSLNTLHDFENILFTNTNCSLCLVAQLSEFCRPWEVKALCLGRSEGRAGIEILSRPSLVDRKFGGFSFFTTFFLMTEGLSYSFWYQSYIYLQKFTYVLCANCNSKIPKHSISVRLMWDIFWYTHQILFFQMVFLQSLSSVCLQTSWNLRIMAFDIFFSNWFWVGMTQTSL